MHSLLKRQLKKYFGNSESVPPGISDFLSAVDNAYAGFDEDREMLERSLDISSKELLQANTNLNAIFEVMPDLFCRIDASGVILDFRGGVETNYGLLAKNAISRSIYELNIFNDDGSLSGAIMKVLKFKQNYNFIYSRTQDNGHKSFEVRLIPLLQDQIIMVIRDISIQIDAEKEIRKHRDHLEHLVAERTNDLTFARDQERSANKAKSLFLSHMSHELRTPLNAIIGYSEMLRETASDGGFNDIVSDVNNINNAGKHLLTLISDILDLSRIEAGKVELNTDLISVENFISDIALIVKPLAGKNNNELSISCTDNPGNLHTDEAKLRQVIINLMGNACKFTEQGKVTLDVKTEIHNNLNWIVFRIIDTGIGISEEHLSSLFDSFSQADSNTFIKYGGTGLGLAISKKLMQILGGNIDVVSTPNEGSVFEVRLKAA